MILVLILSLFANTNCYKDITTIINEKKNNTKISQKIIISFIKKSIIQKCENECPADFEDIIDQEIANALDRLNAYKKLAGVSILVGLVAKIVGNYTTPTITNIVTFLTGILVASALSPFSRKILSEIDKKAFKTIPTTSQKSQSLSRMWESLNSTFSTTEQISVNQLSALIDSIELRTNMILLMARTTSDQNKLEAYIIDLFLEIFDIYDRFYPYINVNHPLVLKVFNRFHDRLLNASPSLNIETLKQNILHEIDLGPYDKINFTDNNYDRYTKYLDIWLAATNNH